MSEFPRPVTLKDGSPATLRRLEPSDTDALAEFFGNLSEADRLVFHPHGFDQDEARLRCEQTVDGDRLVLIVETTEPPGRIVGYGFLWRWDTASPLLGLGVATPAQGLGVGRHLMTTLIESARSAGKDAVVLTVYKQNHRAITLYHSVGFQFNGETDDGLQHAMIWRPDPT